MRAPMVVLVVLLVLLTGCGSTQPADPEVAASDPAAEATTGVLSQEADSRVAAAGSSEVRLFAVGDIGDCTTKRDEAVAQYLRARSPLIATLGDNVYERGTHEEFANCFDPAWGPMMDRLRPAVGNHEYQTPDADGYFDYFGDRAGTRGEGWYSFDLGEHWRVLVLNSQCPEAGGCTSDSPQGQWLRAELSRVGGRNVIATTHAPRYSTGKHGSSLAVKPLFRMLYRGGADIVLSGHDHDYERFAPQNAAGERKANGVQQFVVGTGGRHLYPFERPRLANTRTRNSNTYGVLRLELRPRGYSWKFIPIRGTYTDSGKRYLG